MMMETCLPKGERRRPRPTRAATPAARQLQPGGGHGGRQPMGSGGHGGRRPIGNDGPLTFFFLGSTWYYRGALPFGDGSQEGGKFTAMGGASEK
jgi:hypothetical protein